jgi:hypothetical protein
MSEQIVYSYRGHKIHPAALSFLDHKGRLQRRSGFRIYDAAGSRVGESESLAEAQGKIDQAVEAGKEAG